MKRDLGQADCQRFPFHDDSAIMGIKLIEAMTSEELLLALSDDRVFKAIKLGIGLNTNPNWVTSEIATVLYDRQVINEDRFQDLTR